MNNAALLLALDAPCQRCLSNGKLAFGLECPVCHGTGRLVSKEVRDGVAGLIAESAAAWKEAKIAGEDVEITPTEQTSLSGLICGIADKNEE